MKDRLIHKWFISMVRVIPFSGLGKKNINVVYWLAGWASIVETYLKPNVQKNNHNALWRMENKQWNKPAPHTLVSTQNRLAQIVDGLLSSFSVFKLQSGGSHHIQTDACCCGYPKQAWLSTKSLQTATTPKKIHDIWVYLTETRVPQNLMAYAFIPVMIIFPILIAIFCV